LNIVGAREVTGKNQFDTSPFFCYDKLRGKLKMSVKLAILKSGETVISDVKELVSEEKVCGYIFENPQKVLTERSIVLSEESDYDSKIQVSLTPWIILTEDTQMLVTMDWVVTLVDPIQSLKKMYEEKLNVQSNQMSITEG
jgi:hypothetical protein